MTTMIDINDNDINIDDILRYKDKNFNIHEQLLPYVDNFSNHKKFRTNPTSWRQNQKTNWLLTNKLNQDDTTKLYTSINDLLNKLSESNIESVINSINELKILTDKDIQYLVNTLINESIRNHKFTELYAKLSYKLGSFYVMYNNEKIHFREMLVSQCQDLFEEYMQDITKVNEIKFTGLSRMIAYLYNFNVLSGTVIFLCFDNIYDNLHKAPSITVPSLCNFMSIVGKKYYERDIKNAEKCMQKMNTIQEDKNIGRREKYLVLDLLDVKTKEKWI